MKKAFIRGLAYGALFIFGVFTIAQVSTYTTFAQAPTVSAGGTLNIISDFPFIAFNADSAGTRNYRVLSPFMTPTQIATDQTITSTASYVSAPTADLVTFSCPTTCKVLIEFSAMTYGSGSLKFFNGASLDGAAVVGVEQAVDLQSTAAQMVPYRYYATGLTAASHTAEILHKVSTGTGHILNRVTTVAVIP